jgi:glycosyltransferase involved in cell wall biosynthesis
MSALEGLTVLRYGHVYDSGGGIERYLQDLNRALLQRNRSLRLVQVQLTSRLERVGEEWEDRLLRVSLFVNQGSHERAIAGTGDELGFGRRAKEWFRDQVLYRPLAYRFLTGPTLARRRIPCRAGEPDGAGRAVLSLHQCHPIDLICLHSAGSADAAEILAVADEEQIPVVYVHHFSNDRLGDFAVRAQLDRLAGVAGVCASGVPKFLHRFQNVSDGIDTDFFGPRREKRTNWSQQPIIFLPARITPAKGQMELIRAAGELRRRGLDFRVVLAGRTDNGEYLKELERAVRHEGMAGRVEFVGQLDPEGLRDWYEVASVVAFPTRHHEGLPRILLECQAMKVPPVVYRIGGTAEGVCDGETGYVVGQGDLKGFTGRLEQLLTNDAVRERLAEAGRTWIERNFSLQALASRHEQFYLQALATTARPSVARR